MNHSHLQDMEMTLTTVHGASDLRYSLQSGSKSAEHIGTDVWLTTPVLSFQSLCTQHHHLAVCYPSSILSLQTLLQLPYVQLATPNSVHSNSNRRLMANILRKLCKTIRRFSTEIMQCSHYQSLVLCE